MTRDKGGMMTVRSFSLPLVPVTRAGERQTIRYVIYCHDHQVTGQELKAVAMEEGV